MENKENGGLIDKKAYEEQLERFFGRFWWSSLLFSLSHTLGHLEFLGALLVECDIHGIRRKKAKEK